MNILYFFYIFIMVLFSLYFSTCLVYSIQFFYIHINNILLTTASSWGIYAVY